MTSSVSVYNVKEFLQDGHFISSEEKKNAGAKKEAKVTVLHSKNKNDPAVPYEVIDNPAKLTDKDWYLFHT